MSDFTLTPPIHPEGNHRASLGKESGNMGSHWDLEECSAIDRPSILSYGLAARADGS